MRYTRTKVRLLFTILLSLFIINSACYVNKDAKKHNEELDTTQKHITSIPSKQMENSPPKDGTIITCYKIIETYNDEEYKELFSREDHISLFKDFHMLLKEKLLLKEISFQPLEQLYEYDKEEKFLIKNSEMNQIVKIDGNDTYVNSLNTIIIDDYFANELDHQLSDGRNFTTTDFEYSGQNIPIILGDSYKKYYNIGDVSQYSYLYENFTFEVIGFWKADTTIKFDASEYNLNTYICFPYFNLSSSDFSNQSNRFQNLYYLDRTSGYILAEDSYEDMSRDVKSLSESFHLEYTITEGIYTIGVK